MKGKSTEPSRKNRFFDCFFIVVLCAAFLFASSLASMTVYDDGIVLVGSESVLNGQLPYRDFWSMYGPGQFYFIASVLKLFGKEILVVRFAANVFKILIIVGAFAISKKIMRNVYAYCVAIVIGGFILGLNSVLFPVFPAVALVLAAIYFSYVSAKKLDCRDFVAGILVGLATLFRHDIGFYGAIAISVSSVIYYDYILRAREKLFYSMTLFFSGLFLVLVPAAILLLSNIPWHDLFYDLIYFPAKIYPSNRRTPWPPINFTSLEKAKTTFFGLPVYISILTFPLSLCCLARKTYLLRTRNGDSNVDGNKKVYLWYLLTLTGCLFCVKGLVRVTSLHMGPAIICSVILMFYFLDLASSKGWLIRTSAFLFVVLNACVIFLAAYGMMSLTLKFMTNKEGYRDRLLKACIEPEIEHTSCMPTDTEISRTVDYIVKNTSPEDYIYVGVRRHDKFFANPLIFYYLTDRRSITKWTELHPGLQTQKNIQTDMIADFELKKPKLLVLDSNSDAYDEPNNSSVSSREYALDRYIDLHYKLEMQAGPYSILKRR